MYDLKPNAPSEVRGPYQPIATNVPGIQICEKLPLMAKCMDKLIPIRSMVGSEGAHAGYQCFTGRRNRDPKPSGNWPHMGSAVSKLQGPVQPGIPPFVSLCYTTQHRPYNEPSPGFCGIGHSSFRPSGPGKSGPSGRQEDDDDAWESHPKRRFIYATRPCTLIPTI